METVSCPACRSLLSYPADLAGKAGRCPTCNGVVELPAPAAPAEEEYDYAPERRQSVRDDPDDAWQVDREPVAKKAKKPDKPDPIPGWAWFFVVGCGIIPVITLGGAIPAAVGFGGAGACMSVARNRQMSIEARIGTCIAITVGCWVAVIAVIAAIVASQGRR